MSIRSKLAVCAALFSALGFLFLWGRSGSGVTPPKPLKVLILTDMEGVDGIFNEDLECVPDKSPRWEQSRKLLTGETNAAVEGLIAAGATDVVATGAARTSPRWISIPKSPCLQGRATGSRWTPPTLP